jgi:hypothetical protein
VEQGPNRRIDPMRDDHAYFLGLLATDGAIYEHTRNRGRVSFEIGAADAAILHRLAAAIPYKAHISERRRNTNFRADYSSTVLAFHALDLRRSLALLGYVSGKKAFSVRPPLAPFHEKGFWRGVLDGDGSLGLTRKNRPFVSLVTGSEPLRNAYVAFLSRLTGSRPNPNRNTRDHVYNIVLFDEPAQALAASLYTPEVLAIPRKAEASRAILAWRRPEGRRRVNFDRRRWNADEDRLVLSRFSEADVAAKLGRTKASVSVRRWRLRLSLCHALKPQHQIQFSKDMG